jgi:hypothetical protein
VLEKKLFDCPGASESPYGIGFFASDLCLHDDFQQLIYTKKTFGENNDPTSTATVRRVDSTGVQWYRYLSHQKSTGKLLFPGPVERATNFPLRRTVGIAFLPLYTCSLSMYGAFFPQWSFSGSD